MILGSKGILFRRRIGRSRGGGRRLFVRRRVGVLAILVLVRFLVRCRQKKMGQRQNEKVKMFESFYQVSMTIVKDATMKKLSF